MELLFKFSKITHTRYIQIMKKKNVKSRLNWKGREEIVFVALNANIHSHYCCNLGRQLITLLDLYSNITHITNVVKWVVSASTQINLTSRKVLKANLQPKIDSFQKWWWSWWYRCFWGNVWFRPENEALKSRRKYSRCPAGIKNSSHGAG